MKPNDTEQLFNLRAERRFHSTVQPESYQQIKHLTCAIITRNIHFTCVLCTLLIGLPKTFSEDKMTQNKPIHIISVDSETGVYWYGERILRTTALVKAVIEQIMAIKYGKRG